MNEYLSVSEYAKIKGKDPGNIRKLLAAGRLNGQKVGNQWIIKKDEAYPKDERVKSGKYRNWRKRICLYENKSLIKTLTKMVFDLRQIYEDNISEIIVYGSYARGTQTDESDVDIALLLFETPSKEITNAMINCVSRIEIECGKVLSVIEIDEKKYNTWKDIMPFYKNIQKEGIQIWKATA